MRTKIVRWMSFARLAAVEPGIRCLLAIPFASSISAAEDPTDGDPDFPLAA